MKTKNHSVEIFLPALLTAEQVCQLRSCHGGTLRRARKAGRIEFTQVNTRVFLYHRDSVLEWLGLKPKPGPKPRETPLEATVIHK